LGRQRAKESKSVHASDLPRMQGARARRRFVRWFKNLSERRQRLIPYDHPSDCAMPPTLEKQVLPAPISAFFGFASPLSFQGSRVSFPLPVPASSRSLPHARDSPLSFYFPSMMISRVRSLFPLIDRLSAFCVQDGQSSVRM